MAGLVVIWHRDGRPMEPETLRAVAIRGRHLGSAEPRLALAGPLGMAHVPLDVAPPAERERLPLGSTEDGLWLVADARLDNRSELLVALGLRATSEDPLGDGGLILAAYRRWGEECPERLVGDFAFVLWDPRRRALFAARDALGVRCLCFAELGSTLALATEGQMLLGLPGLPARLDEVSAVGWLCNLHSESRTMYRGVARLPGGHALRALEGGVHTSRYWRPEGLPGIRYRREAEHASHLRELLSRCVGDRLRCASGVVGTYVSGGMDSTSVTALAAERLGRGTDRLVPLNWEYRTLTSCQETPYAEAVARRWGLRLRKLDAERFWQLDDLDRYPFAQEEPGEMFDSLHGAGLGLFRERGAQVLLTGTGGDHLTSGTWLANLERLGRGDVRVVAELWRWSRRVGEPFRRTVARNFLRPLVPDWALAGFRRLARRAGRAPVPPWVPEATAARLGIASHFARPRPRVRGSRALGELWHQITAPNLPMFCRREQRLGAGFGIDVRQPFADRRLAELVHQVDPGLWVGDTYGKLLLRRAMADLLPASVTRRLEKTLFGAHWALGLKGEARVIKDLLVRGPLSGTALFRCRAANNLYDRYLELPGEKAVPEVYDAIMVQGWLAKHELTDSLIRDVERAPPDERA